MEPETNSGKLMDLDDRYLAPGEGKQCDHIPQKPPKTVKKVENAIEMYFLMPLSSRLCPVNTAAICQNRIDP